MNHSTRPILLLILAACVATAGCQQAATTDTRRVFDDVTVGGLLSGRMQVNRLATHSPFGLAWQTVDHKPSARYAELEQVRIAEALGRVIAKSYTHRTGSLVGGYSQVEYVRVIEAELPEEALQPAPEGWEPIGRQAVLPLIAAIVADAEPGRIYAHNRTPPRDFIDLRNAYYDELASRVYARALATALAEGVDSAVNLPQPADDADAWSRQIEAQAARYARQKSANEREIEVVNEQLVRINYAYQFSEAEARKQQMLALKEGLESKIQTLRQANQQIDQLLGAMAQQVNPRLAMARWQAAHDTATQQAHRALEMMRGNVAGYLLATVDLMEMMPAPEPPEGLWQGKPWSKLWPRHDLVDALRAAGLDAPLEAGPARETTLPSGIRVRTSNLGDRRIRVEITYRFYEYPIWN